ncbi:bifunctional DNA-formamidopyrimidine glycosylase/DNA-(apurinic or apyrimidinic site) lyase [Bartonella sp. DGB2]|uniref:bifunctional DNA-formamidopyrimidine glycosylase/DNA-(apurinic or apyrimidinic site) lyase n=1 Tax=Bartonella sp. DGB2 TaxID=3388426 RepID=UPI00398FEA20
MPELPEVETVLRGLVPYVHEAHIIQVTLTRPNLRFSFPKDFPKVLVGQMILGLERRSKYLLFHLNNGYSMISHLGMSGSWRLVMSEGASKDVSMEQSKSPKHDHVMIALLTKTQQRIRLVYNDPRRFGFLLLAKTVQLPIHPLLKKLGPEPFGGLTFSGKNSLTGTYLTRVFASKMTPLKTVLLDQSVVAGLGNIYVCEALWRAALCPKRPASSLKGWAVEKLVAHIYSVIDEAIIAGGSSLRDHRQVDGRLGYFQNQFSIYGRAGEACLRCGGMVEVMRQAGRSTFYCPSCQN